jgi:hypothetical protein
MKLLIVLSQWAAHFMGGPNSFYMMEAVYIFCDILGAACESLSHLHFEHLRLGEPIVGIYKSLTET